MEKQNKVLIGLVIFLIIIVLGLGGFIVYDKVLDKKEDKQEEKKPDVQESATDNSSTTKPEAPVKEDHSVILNGGWYQNDVDVIKVNYESVKNEGTVNGLHIKHEKDYSDSVYQTDVELGWMTKEDAYDDSYTINNKITFMNARHGCGSKNTILLAEKYMIIYSVGCNGTGGIRIYDKNNNLVKETRHGFQENSDVSELEPVVHNHKLYYYGFYRESDNETGGIKYIDLTVPNLTETTIKSW